MNETEFAKAYLQYEENIKKVLNSKMIYDEDLLHDTYIDLYEWTQDNTVDNFVNVFVEFFQKRYNWREKNESQLESYDNEHLAALEIIDESQDEEKLDSNIDYYYEQFRYENKERLHKLLNYYYRHPQPGERDHKRACRILRLYLKGQSFREIARTLKLDIATVYKYFSRTIEKLKIA